MGGIAVPRDHSQFSGPPPPRPDSAPGSDYGPPDVTPRSANEPSDTARIPRRVLVAIVLGFIVGGLTMVEEGFDQFAHLDMMPSFWRLAHRVDSWESLVVGLGLIVVLVVLLRRHEIG